MYNMLQIKKIKGQASDVNDTNFLVNIKFLCIYLSYHIFIYIDLVSTWKGTMHISISKTSDHIGNYLTCIL